MNVNVNESEQQPSTQEEVEAAIDGLRDRMGDRLLVIVAEATLHASQILATEDENRLFAELRPISRGDNIYASAVTTAMIHQNVALYAASLAQTGASPEEVFHHIAEIVGEAIGEGFRIHEQTTIERMRS